MPLLPAESPDPESAENPAVRDDAAELALRSLTRGEVLAVIAHLAEAASGALAVERVCLWHYDRLRSVLVCAAAWDRGRIVPEPLVLSREAHPEFWSELHSEDGASISDTRDHPTLEALQVSYIQRHAVRALVACRMQIEGGTLGFISVEHRDGPRDWSLLERRFVRSLADYAGMAILVHAQRRLDGFGSQSRRMEALALMAGRVAHDFNNKLSVILSSAGAARALQARGENIDEDLVAIESAVQQATLLTRKLLYFGRGEVTARETFDLNAMVRAFEAEIIAALPLSVRPQSLLASQPLAVHAEPAFVEQAMHMLCTNAIDAMPNGGSLTIATRQLTVDGTRLTHGVALPAGAYAHLRVLDTGEGIPAASLTRVFDPFFSTRGRTHAGLGLSMIYAGMRQHGGFIGIESVVGRGTVVHLFFPLRDTAS